MKKNNGRKPVHPVYIFGAVFLGYSLLFSLSGVWSFIKCTVLALAIYGILTSNAKKKKTNAKREKAPPSYKRYEYHQQTVPPQKAESEKAETDAAAKERKVPPADNVVEQGRFYVNKIRELNEEIPDFKISAQLKQIEILTTSIIEQVEGKEDKQKEIRQFMNYYLPTTIHLLEKYVQFQNVGMQGENIQSGMQRIEDMLDKVIVAFQKQLDNLFERDIVDITADIQVMEQMMKAQGLTNETDF